MSVIEYLLLELPALFVYRGFEGINNMYNNTFYSIDWSPFSPLITNGVETTIRYSMRFNDCILAPFWIAVIFAHEILLILSALFVINLFCEYYILSVIKKIWPEWGNKLQHVKQSLKKKKVTKKRNSKCSTQEKT
jgi:hypothetical protein